MLHITFCMLRRITELDTSCIYVYFLWNSPKNNIANYYGCNVLVNLLKNSCMRIKVGWQYAKERTMQESSNNRIVISFQFLCNRFLNVRFKMFPWVISRLSWPDVLPWTKWFRCSVSFSIVVSVTSKTVEFFWSAIKIFSW